ncbi:hypothetical protein MLD38_027176 [Melastoma candidum]|uniref:Uncharacterized protein n=1 Tax=Melastoma candidum TaxID=119954 RepID=A0ACB9P3Z3_9MYRT|nr:hypothetical protein MLD38_027176 [Melastoma candidum]
MKPWTLQQAIAYAHTLRIYPMITLLELTFYKLQEWVPIWSYAKLVLIGWLVIAYFSGAAYGYEHFMRPAFVRMLIFGMSLRERICLESQMTFFPQQREAYCRTWHPGFRKSYPQVSAVHSGN